MSPEEAAQAYGMNKQTVLKWVRSGRLPAERVQKRNGPGYDIRPEDMLQAVNLPRKRTEAPKAAVQGSVVAELQAMRAAVERLEAEVHDLRGQLHQTEGRLAETLRALPPPKAKKRGIWPFRRAETGC